MMVFRRLGLALGVLLLTTPAFATQGAQRQATAIANVNGAAKVLAFAQVKVCTYDPANPTTCATTITLFKDPAMTVPFPSNPIQTDQNGNYSYYTNAGNYVEQLCATGATCRTQVVTLGGAGGGSANFPQGIPFATAPGGTAQTAVPGNVSAMYVSTSTAPTNYLATTFNEASAGTSLTGTTPATCQSGCTGAWHQDENAAWVYASGGGATTSTPTTDALAATWIDVGHSDYTYHIGVPNYGGGASFFAAIFRYTDHNNTLFLNFSSGLLQLFDETGGVFTSLGFSNNINFNDITVVVSGSSIEVTSSAGTVPIHGTLPGGSANLTSTKVGFNLEAGGPSTIASLTVSGPATVACTGFLNSNGHCGVEGPANALLMADPQGLAVLPLPGAAYVPATNQANLPGLLITQSEENRPRGVFDPMNLKYAGGLGNATTSAQQQAVIQATLDAAGCAVATQQLQQAEVIVPASIKLSLSEVNVFAGTDFHCSAPDDALFGQCEIDESAPIPTRPTIPITSVNLTASVLTVTSSAVLNGPPPAPPLLSVGNNITFPGAMVASFLDGKILTVTSVSTNSFTANFPNHADYPTTGENTTAPVTPSSDDGHRLLNIDFSKQGMCNGTMTTMGASNAHIHGFNLVGAGSEAGGNDEGVRIFDLHSRVDHITAHNFGGAAIEVNGQDSYGAWNLITASVQFYIFHDTAPIPQLVGPDKSQTRAAMECMGVDTMCEWNEVSSGDNSGHVGANYPNIAAFKLDGGSGRFPNNFAQVSWVGLIVPCCSSHNTISDFRVDLMSGSSIVTQGGGNSYSGITINGACQDGAHWVAAGLDPSTGNPLGPSVCNAIQDTGTGGDSFSTVIGSPQPGGDRSFVKGVMGVGADDISVTGLQNVFPKDAFGNGANYDRLATDPFNTTVAPPFTQVNLGYCQGPGAPTIGIVNCSHLILTDTSPVSIQSITGGTSGAELTIEGTVFDTIIAGAPFAGSPTIATCQNQNIVLGNGGQQVFSYSGIDHIWHQQCNNSFPIRASANFVGNTAVDPAAQGAFDGFGNFTAHELPNLPAPILDCGQCNTPSAFTNCYVETIFVNGGMETSTAPLCSNQTLVASGPSIMGLKPALFPGWQKVSLYRWSTTQPGIALGLLATFTPSNIPAPNVTAFTDSGQAPIDSSEPSALGINWTATLTGNALFTVPTTLSTGTSIICNPLTFWADDNFLYHCNASGTAAKRVALSTF